MIEPIFNMFKVKFSVMDSLNIIAFDTKSMVFYINLENVFKVLYTKHINNYVKSYNNPKDIKLEICSCILNLASHYKLYCAKARVDCKVVLYMNYPDMTQLINKLYVPDYKDCLNTKLTRNVDNYIIVKYVDEVYDFINIIVKYLDNIYLVDSQSAESSLIPYILYRDKFNEAGTKHVLISNTKYEWQYTNNDFHILIPNGDDSIVVDKNNVYDIMKLKMNIKNDKTISPNFLPFVITILGDKYRNLDKIPGVGLSHTIDMIDTALKELLITDNTTNIDMLSSIISDNYKQEFINKYKCVDIRGQYDSCPESVKSNILEKIEDKFDEYTLDAINDKYFKNSPLLIVDTKKHKFNSVNNNDREEGKSIF